MLQWPLFSSVCCERERAMVSVTAWFISALPVASPLPQSFTSRGEYFVGEAESRSSTTNKIANKDEEQSQSHEKG